jgi:hypothetical protein
MNRARLLLLAAALGGACAHAPEQAQGEPSPAPAAPQASAPEKRPPKDSRPAATAPRRGDKAEKSATARPAAPKPATVAGGPADYWPLAIGNEWIYVDRSPALPENRRGELRTVRILERTADGF